MNLRAITRKAITSLEQKSGYLVSVVADPALPTLATIRVARGNLPAHVLTYKPGTKGETPDFAICWQCAFAARMYACPPDRRFLIAGDAEGEHSLEKILQAPNGIAEKIHLDPAQLQTFKSMLLNGLITHLRSVPVGLRVSETLTLEFPDLLELETENVRKELAVANESLSASIKDSMPAEIYHPTQSINAAHALFWAERLEQPEIVNPFRSAGFETDGQGLLDIYRSIPAGPENDNTLIDRWADYLGLRNWYSWLPYQAP